MKHFFLSILAGVCLIFSVSAAHALETAAREAYLVDLSTGTVLLEKNADQQMPTSSMSKMMTIYMLFDALKNGRYTLDDTFTVSEKAWRMGSSKQSSMYVLVGSKIRLEDLIRGVIVQSGNDATVVVAEGFSGSEEAFSQEMTEKAHALGMVNSQFMNASGLPMDGHYSTARDLAILGLRTLTDFPEYFHYYGEKEFTWSDIKQQNRNPLIGLVAGADGFKTGHASEAGYGLVGTAERNGRRLLLVVNGLSSMSERARESQRLLEWGFREFQPVKIVSSAEEMGQVSVWEGQYFSTPAIATRDVSVSLDAVGKKALKVTLVTKEPIQAPVKKGQEIGTLRIEAPGMVQEVPLVAAIDVPRLGFLGRIINNLRHLVGGDAQPEDEEGISE
ncbi:MAG TPA: D-alanyl-D-alanine carboxypeptidase [Rhodospirillaceae bacterium]|nr:MAG: D-alanyl-D-alanine carboxypeptidase [Alphaproteobacteria bacterium GWF2_58_20]HAU28739.1 D-alanyl-D-alanine carboxypeptidase [Rhodospirillaceae bacterium]